MASVLDEWTQSMLLTGPLRPRLILCSVFICLRSKVAGKCSCKDVLNVIIWAVFLIGCSLETPFGKATSVFVVKAFLQSPEGFLLRKLIVEIVVCMFPFLSIQNLS